MLPIFLILCFLFPLPTTCFTNHTDLLSLLAFKSSLKDPQGALVSWNQTSHFCTWNGIQCGHRHIDRVVAINLTSQGLVGSLSPHVGNLSFLRTIILQNNTFQGPIPREVGCLERLERLDFFSNSFIGSIPKHMSNFSNHLVYLDLMDNKLSGSIPFELGFMSKLEFLYLSENNLSGTIPPSIGNITSLLKLSLLSCGLIGEIPESLAQLKHLELLSLGNNGLTGTIPYALFNISTIESLYVAMNQLHGVIPSTIALTLPNLKSLYLFRNNFTGPLPASISNASLLERVEMNFNYFTGPIPRVDSLTRLQHFIFGANLIVDDVSFISSLTNSTNLVYLEVYENSLTGSFPDSIANLTTQLKSLFFWTNKIHGKIPSAVGNLIKLEAIALYENFLEGPIPVTIGKLSKLHHLNFRENKLTDEIPSSLGNLTSLDVLSLSENNLSGNLPSTLSNCTNLQALDIGHNNFDGLIPQQIMSLSSISIVFNLSYNDFVGPIPYEVGSLTNLGILDLSNNRLSGLIPNSLGKCTSLEQLYLERNLLEGEIPTEISTLMGLGVLDLSRNNLSGEIPSFLGKLNLSILNLSFNRLQGEVPTIGIFRNKTSISLDGNQQLCGGISELNLPSCPPAKSGRAKFSTLLKILIPILVVGGICLVLLAFFTCKKSMSRENVSASMSPLVGVQFMRLSYAELLKATGGFAEANLLGTGRFGSVYKGILDDGQTLVAVKVLNLFARGASKTFTAECNAFRDVRHRNLLKILSVCESIDFQGNDFKALVYEFKANGSLEKWLYHKRDEDEGRNSETNNLNMIQRLNIAIDIAKAIEYLHFGTESSIVHGDLKPSNILLDHAMTACVGDFGLAKIVSNAIPSHESSTSIGIRGTLGYVPPEYGTSQAMSTQGDVYSYGILLLEMFTNKRPTDDSFKDHVNLHGFVQAALPNRLQEIVDPLLQIEIDIKYGKAKDCMASILSIGVACSKEMPGERMSIADVVNELHMIQKLLRS